MCFTSTKCICNAIVRHVMLCLWWMVCPPSRGLVFLSFLLSPDACVWFGWCARLPYAPDAFSPIVSAHVCLQLPAYRWMMYAFRDVVSPWPPLFDTVSQYELQCWMVRGLSEILPPLVCHCFVPVCFPSYLSNTIFLAFLNAFSWV